MDRRNFLQSALAIAGTASLSTPSFAAFAQNIDVDAPPQMPGGDLFTQNEEEYWRQIRRQFIIPEDEIYLNNGTVGSCPLPVLKAVFDSYRETNRLDEANPEDYPIWGYGCLLYTSRCV